MGDEIRKMQELKIQKLQAKNQKLNAMLDKIIKAWTDDGYNRDEPINQWLDRVGIAIGEAEPSRR